jgi:hypothetical protein
MAELSRKPQSDLYRKPQTELSRKPQTELSRKIGHNKNSLQRSGIWWFIPIQLNLGFKQPKKQHQMS